MSARNMAKRTAAGTLALAVCLGGGALALAGAAQADANFKFDSRIAGDDRYETAIAASKAAFPTDGSSENVILVNGYATVDGLTASYLAGVAKAPILYVSDKGADAKTQAEIKRLGVKNVWLVGGTTVIPQSVEDAIKVDYKVTRINGSDRYETAKMIAEAGAKISGKQPSKVFVASGTSFADALAVSPVAYAKGYAIALTEKDSTSGYTKDELKAVGADTKILVGGTAVVSDSVAKDLGVTKRVAGDDRAITANLVADWAKDTEGFNRTQAGLVGGTNGNGADSLVASSVLGKTLTTLHFAGWDATYTYLKDHSAELTGKGVVFGGKAAVNDDQVSKAQAAAQTVAASVSSIVTSADTANNKFSYADASTGKVVTVTYLDTANFKVDGTAATVAVFESKVAKGDTIQVTKESDGKFTYSLVNKVAADYSEGLIGAVDAGASKFSISEAISGVSLNDVTWTGTYTIYTVDGTTVSATAFGQAISIGDTVSVKGTGADASNIRTIALANKTVSGTVSDKNVGDFKITGTTGAALGFFNAGGTDKLTVDGTVVLEAAFEAALSNGDTVTYSKSGDVQTIALVNAAPSAVLGQATSVTVTDGVLRQFVYVTSAGSKTVDLSTALTVQSATAATSTTKEIQTFDLGATFDGAGYRPKLLVKYGTASSSYPTTGKLVSVDLPAKGSSSAADYATALAAAIKAGINAADTHDEIKNATVSVNSTTWRVTVNSGTDNVNVTDIASAVLYEPTNIFLDGKAATATEVSTDLTIGDAIKFQAPDRPTSTVAKFDITNATIDAVVKGFDGSDITVYAKDSSEYTLTPFAYNDGADLGLPGTSANAIYTINGASKDATAFDTALDAIEAGALKGSIKVTQSGTKTLYALTTSVS